MSLIIALITMPHCCSDMIQSDMVLTFPLKLKFSVSFYVVNFVVCPSKVDRYQLDILLFFIAVKTCVLQVNMGSSVRRDAHVRMEECVTM